MEILVGSKNKHKVNAVRRAAAELQLNATVTGLNAESEVSANPSGHEETLIGSNNRARNVRKRAHADYYIGLESGFEVLLGRTYVINWCTIMNNRDQAAHVSGLKFEKPSESGLTGFIGVASRGALTREDIIYTLIRDGLILMRSKEQNGQN